jgi:hypothetical protein
MQPLRITSRLAFSHSSDDVLAIAGEALSRMWSNEGRAVWQFTQGVTPLQPVGAGSWFQAIAGYTRHGENMYGAQVVSHESVRLTCTSNSFRNNGRLFSGFILDFSDSDYGASVFEAMVAATCYYIIQSLRERRWIADESAPGFWQLSRRWEDRIIANALGMGPHDLGMFLIVLQKYGLFPAINQTAMNDAVWVRRLFNV